jgi:hypothetical protein
MSGQVARRDSAYDAAGVAGRLANSPGTGGGVMLISIVTRCARPERRVELIHRAGARPGPGAD